MVAVQADCAPAEALHLLVAHAALHKRSIDETASDVIDHRIRFDVNSGGPPLNPRQDL